MPKTGSLPAHHPCNWISCHTRTPAELRLIEAILKNRHAESAAEVLREFGAEAVWTQALEDDYASIKAAVPGRSTEGAMDQLATLARGDPQARVLLTDILAALPRPEEPEKEPDEEAVEEPRFGPDRVSREELYTAAARGGRITTVTLVLAALSAVVASVGIIRDNTGGCNWRNGHSTAAGTFGRPVARLDPW